MLSHLIALLSLYGLGAQSSVDQPSGLLDLNIGMIYPDANLLVNESQSLARSHFTSRSAGNIPMPSAVIGCVPSAQVSCEQLFLYSTTYPVIATPRVFVTWYGNWDVDKKHYIRTLFNNLGGSSYLAILKSYDIAPIQPTGNLEWGGEQDYIPDVPTLDPNSFFNLIPTLWSNPRYDDLYFVFTSLNLPCNVSMACGSSLHGNATGPTAGYHVIWIDDGVRCGSTASQCITSVVPEAPTRLMDTFIYRAMGHLVQLIVFPYRNIDALTPLVVCMNVQSNRKKVKLGVQDEYFLPAIVEFRSIAQACSTEAFCWNSASYHCIPFVEHSGDDLSAHNVYDYDYHLQPCAEDETCLGFDRKMFKSAVTPYVRSLTNDLHVKGCECHACGSRAVNNNVNVSCGTAVSKCSGSSAANKNSCWASWTDPVAPGSVCACPREPTGRTCANATPLSPLLEGNRAYVSNIATDKIPSAPVNQSNNCSVSESGRTVYFNLTTPVVSLCKVSTCGGTHRIFNTILAVFSSCSDTQYVACNDNANTSGCSTVSFYAQKPWYIAAVSTNGGRFTGHFSLDFECVPTTPFPTSRPSRRPTNEPTVRPSRRPTAEPTRRPSKFPTSRPSRRPTAEPTRRPSKFPTSRPSRRPTKEPTVRPSRRPTAEPTRRPSKFPTSRPTRRPTKEPTVRPSRRPTVEPTRRPSKFPTSLQ